MSLQSTLFVFLSPHSSLLDKVEVFLLSIKAAPSSEEENPNIVKLSHIRSIFGPHLWVTLGEVDLSARFYALNIIGDRKFSKSLKADDRDVSNLIKKINQHSRQWHQLPSDLPSSADSDLMISSETEGVKLFQDIKYNPSKTNLTEKQWEQTRTENFREWFGDSKVVDGNGDPLVVLHGSQVAWDAFDLNEARQTSDIVGAYFSSAEEEAETYGYGGYVRKFFLSIQNPAPYDYAYDVFRSNRTKPDAGAITREALIAEGYDGVILREEGENDQYIVLSPNQIKSVPESTEDFKIKIKISNGFIGGLIILDEVVLLMENESLWHTIYAIMRALDKYTEKAILGQKYRVLFVDEGWSIVKKFIKHLRAYSESEISEERRNRVQHPRHTSVLNKIFLPALLIVSPEGKAAIHSIYSKRNDIEQAVKQDGKESRKDTEEVPDGGSAMKERENSVGVGAVNKNSKEFISNEMPGDAESDDEPVAKSR